jgi:hypothetical protein
VPKAQIVQKLGLVLPVLAVEEPAAQGVHDASFPTVDLDVPIGQTVQAPSAVLSVAPAFANLPAGQVFAVKVKHDPPLPVV